MIELKQTFEVYLMDYQSNIDFVIQGAVSFTDLMWLIVHSFFVTQCWFFSFVCFVIAVWDGDIPERSKNWEGLWRWWEWHASLRFVFDAGLACFYGRCCNYSFLFLVHILLFTCFVYRFLQQFDLCLMMCYICVMLLNSRTVICLHVWEVVLEM